MSSISLKFGTELYKVRVNRSEKPIITVKDWPLMKLFGLVVCAYRHYSHNKNKSMRQGRFFLRTAAISLLEAVIAKHRTREANRVNEISRAFKLAKACAEEDKLMKVTSFGDVTAGGNNLLRASMYVNQLENNLGIQGAMFQSL